MLKITALPTRDIREKLQIIRKRLYLVDFFIWKFVVMKVYRSYSQIYAKNMEACRLAKKIRIDAPKHFLDIPFLLLSTLSWEGDNISMNFNFLNKEDKVKLIFKILDWLKTFNSPSQKYTRFLDFRYIELFLKKEKQLRLKRNLTSRIIKLVKQSRLEIKSCGPGIEDVVLSNFTQTKNSVRLVDFDNFGERVNFDYEVGFLLSDIEIECGFSESEILTLWGDYTKKRLLKTDTNMFAIGRISRYAINAINSFDSKKVQVFDFEKNIKIIDRILRSIID